MESATSTGDAEEALQLMTHGTAYVPSQAALAGQSKGWLTCVK